MKNLKLKMKKEKARCTNKKLRERGITLIALVVTIVVLLILAGISISIVLGEGGIIDSARRAGELTNAAIANEQQMLQNLIDLADEYLSRNGESTNTEGGQPPVQENRPVTEIALNKTEITIGIGATATIQATVEPENASNKELTWNSSEDGIIEIDDDGAGTITLTALSQGTTEITAKAKDGSDVISQKCTITVENPVTTAQIVENVKDWIGQEVIYENPSSSSSEKYKWLVFYAGKVDETNGSEANHIYLIANDYIEFNDAPKGKGGTELTKKDTSRSDGKSYQLSMNNVVSDYKGTSDITEEKLKKLNKDYFITKGYSDDANNQGKALAFMMDSTKWGEKFGGDLADYVIGGPTIELLFKAYNKKYNLTGNNEYKAEASINGSAKGYKISNDGGQNYSTSISGMLRTEDRTFVISETDKCSQTWVASPSADGISNVMLVACNGRVSYYAFISNDTRLASLGLSKI